MNLFHNNPPPENTKFVAFYSDGSGASLYWRKEDKEGGPCYMFADGEEIQYGHDWFEDSGYLWWMPIPNDFKLWCERS